MLKEGYENKIKQLVQIYQGHSKPDDFRSCEYKSVLYWLWLTSMVTLHRLWLLSITTGATSGAGVAYLPKHLNSTWGCKVRVTQALVFSVVSCVLCWSFVFPVGHGLVCLPTERFLSASLVSSNSLFYKLNKRHKTILLVREWSKIIYLLLLVSITIKPFIFF